MTGSALEGKRIDKMRDEMDARLWVEHGAEFSRSLSEAFAKLRIVFERLHAIEFSAPWRGSKTGQA
jgi:hypothetical protein